jgi:hypothetical protein
MDLVSWPSVVISILVVSIPDILEVTPRHSELNRQKTSRTTTPSRPSMDLEENDGQPEAATQAIQPATAYDLSSSKSPLFAIEHPAILSSIEAGIRSLGGASKLSKVSSLRRLFTRRSHRIIIMQSSNCGTEPMINIDTPSFLNLFQFRIWW